MQKIFISSLSICCLVLGGHSAALASSDTEALPNILILMAEDMSSRVGAFGDDVANTPRIDELANEGVRYPQAFTTAGVCAPSRAAMVLGMHQISTGTQHMRSSNGPTGGYQALPPAHVKAFPELLRRAGYYTFTDGKLDYQFSHIRANSGPFTIWDAEGFGSDWSGRQGGQPFFGWLNFIVTHEGGVMTPLGHWPNSVIHVVMQVTRALSGNRVSGGPVEPKEIKLEPYYPDTQIIREDIARHYNNIHDMDRRVGEILDRLEAEAVLENTIIIWTTDHGDGLPRAKRDLYDSGIKVPMIIRWPEHLAPDGVAPGSLDNRLISMIDLAPTILRLAGVDSPEYLQGQDIVSSAPREFVFASRDRIDEVQDRRRAARSSRFKYLRNWYPDLPAGHALDYRGNLNMVKEMQTMFVEGRLNEVQGKWFKPQGAEELYDLDKDPFEVNNLIADPTYSKDLDQMRGALDQWLTEIDDLSDLSEAEMLKRLGIAAEPQQTVPPTFEQTSSGIALSSATEGASIGYRINGGLWQIYSAPVSLKAGQRLEAKSVRYGFLESETSELMQTSH